MKKLIRTVQTRFPFMLDLKVEAQRRLRRTLRRPSERIYELFRTFPFPGDSIFLDIGANNGQTIDSFRLYNKSLQICAFEPNPILAEKLAKRYDLDACTLINPFGLADKEGDFRFYIPSYRKFPFDGLASFDADSARTWLSPRFIYNFDPSLVSVQEITCRTKRLDDLHLNPALAKIDVQGFETHVLQGGMQTIDRCRPVFIIENDEKMTHADFLSDLDYSIAAFEDGHFHLDRSGLINSAFIPREKVASLTAYCERTGSRH